MSKLARRIGRIGKAGLAAIATMASLGAASAADMAPPMFGGQAPAMGAAAPIGIAPPVGGSSSMDDPAVTFATGWYLRGDLGVAKDIQVNVGRVTLPKGSSFPNNWSIGLGAGYKFNNWLRADLTLDWRAPRTFNGNTAFATCTTGWHLTSPTTEAAFTDICSDSYQARLTNTTALFNLYADLGTWWGLTPYVGAGIGFNYVYQKQTQSWFMSNGVPYQVNTPDALNTSLSWYYNWNNARSQQSTQLAWALMGGFSYALTPNVAVDIGARYLNLGTVRSYSAFTGAAVDQSNTAKEIRIGLRYTPD